MTKPTKWFVRSAKTQFSLGIHPVWSELSLSAWRKLGSLATQWVHSKDSDQTGQMSRLIWVFARRTVILLVLSWGSSIIWDKPWENQYSEVYDHMRSDSNQPAWQHKPASLGIFYRAPVCIIWATSWENLFMPYANNKGADQYEHLRSLISTFIVRYWDSMIPVFAMHKISRLASRCSGTGRFVSYHCRKLPKTGFLVTWLISSS